MRNFSGKLSCLYSLLCYIYHLRTRDLRTKVGDTSEVIFHRYDGIFLRFIIEPLFLIKVARLDFLRGQKYFQNIFQFSDGYFVFGLDGCDLKRTPKNGEKGHSHPIRRQNSRLRTGKYFENISDIWKKCVILDLCLFMFEKYIHPEELKLAFIFLYF